MSINVWFNAWPKCRLPVTFGGGITTQNAGLPPAGAPVK
jgi:hypothetical protein